MATPQQIHNFTHYKIKEGSKMIEDENTVTIEGGQFYFRKPFRVEAIQVTAENVEAVAEWCGGKLATKPATKKWPETTYIKVPVKRPLTHRQGLAYPGDWVLNNGSGFKVYTAMAFQNSFDLEA